MIETFILIFIGAFIFMLVYFFVLDEEVDPEIQRRLNETKNQEKSTRKQSEGIFKVLASKEKSKKINLIEMLKEQSDYRIPMIGLILSRFKFIEKIRYLLKIADIKMPIDVFFMIVIGLFFPFIILALLNKNPIFLLGGIGGAFLPFFYLKMKFNKRLDKFSNMFPEALGIISNSLKAGHSLLASFQMVAAESSYPINKMFKTVSDEISLGREMREALEDMSQNLPGSQDLKFFTTAVLIQKEIGGNLAEILDTLQHTIRERHKLLGMIKTQTSQAQLSGMVLGLAPVAIAGLVNLINPQYMEPLFHSTLGHLALFIACSMSFMGLFIIKKVTQIRV